MTTPPLRVMLVSPALNPALREARFDGDTPLDPSGAHAARTAAPHLPAADRYAAGASARCRATARELSLRDPGTLEVAPAGWESGRWSGRRLDEAAAEPEAVAAWASDPEAAPHGGERRRGEPARAAGPGRRLAGGGRGRRRDRAPGPGRGPPPRRGGAGRRPRRRHPRPGPAARRLLAPGHGPADPDHPHRPPGPLKPGHRPAPRPGRSGTRRGLNPRVRRGTRPGAPAGPRPAGGGPPRRHPGCRRPGCRAAGARSRRGFRCRRCRSRGRR